MRAITCVGMTLLAAATLLQAGVDARDSAVLIVRLYNTSGVAASELRAARAAAEPLLRDAGVGVAFRQCGPLSDDGTGPCPDRLSPSEVVVRVIDAPAFNTTLHPDAYGVTYVVRETNRGWLATVFADRIHGAAARVGIDPGPLLGRVMAHEIGHLLLGSDYHGDGGLMRAEWPDALLERAAGDWRFSRGEAARINRMLESLTADARSDNSDPRP